MNKKVVILGGGTGMSTLLRGLKQFPLDITAIVSVCDDGGSTGILRDEFDILAVGDIRKVLVALSQTESSVEELLNHRFNTNGTLNKHTVGNILLTAATEMTGSIQQGIELLGKVLNLCGNVMPVTESNITLSAEMMDGSIVDGEHFITASSKKIKRVFYKETPEINDSLLKEIKSADLIVFSMGSLYTSILPCLLSKEIINKLDKSSAPIVYACNLFTQPGETDKFKVSDHLKIINSYLGKRKIDVVIANNGKIDERLAYKYLSTEQKDPVLIDYDETKKNVKKIIEDNLITIENGVFRHDTLKLGYLLFSEVLRLKKNKRKKKY